MQTARGPASQLSARTPVDGGVRLLLPAPPAIRSQPAHLTFSSARQRHLAPGALHRFPAGTAFCSSLSRSAHRVSHMIIALLLHWPEASQLDRPTMTPCHSRRHRVIMLRAGLAATQTLEPAVLPRWQLPSSQPPAEALSPRSAVAAAQAQLAAEDSETWKDGGFPAYLQSQLDDFCAAWDDALAVSSVMARRAATCWRSYYCGWLCDRPLSCLTATASLLALHGGLPCFSVQHAQHCRSWHAIVQTQEQVSDRRHALAL